MALDFQQVQQQVRELGENAAVREQHRTIQRQKAQALLESFATEIPKMRQKVLQTARLYDQNLRCALPVVEGLTTSYPAPPAVPYATLLAADGSQIMPDRHAEVSYFLVNVGAIQLRCGSSAPPQIEVQSKLMYDDQLYTDTGMMGESDFSLARDVAERTLLAELAEGAEQPVLTFTDGPLEIWGVKDASDGQAFQEKLNAYLKALQKLCDLGAATAGYVDKPGANMVTRLLEIMITPEEELPNIKRTHPLRGITDIDLYRERLNPGDRSAVFAIQSKSAANYRDDLSLHFFYLNVGWEGRPWLARVEAPRWVVEDSVRLDSIHAALLQQCRIMGRRPYPYLLHRAHEAAVVTYQEKEQVTGMIMAELRRRSVTVGEVSYKQSAKNLPGKTRYSG